jgi:hypothetical protein
MPLEEYLRLMKSGAKQFGDDLLDEYDPEDEIDPNELNERLGEFLAERVEGEMPDDDELNFDDG